MKLYDELIESEINIEELRKSSKEKTKDKEFKNLSSTEKWALVETMAKMMGLINSVDYVRK